MAFRAAIRSSLSCGSLDTRPRKMIPPGTGGKQGLAEVAPGRFISYRKTTGATADPLARGGFLRRPDSDEII